MTKYVKSIKFSTSGETYVIRDAEQKSRLDTLEPQVAEKADTTAVNTALAGKQNKLTAGANITIENDVISATGGSGGGAVDSVNGKTGTVVLEAADVQAATEAQGALADTAVQPADIADMETQTHASDTYQTKLTSANAGNNVQITEVEGVVKISATGGGSGSANWGSIGGTLSDQTDLQNALNAKAGTDNLKTINSESLVGSGDIELLTSNDLDNYYTKQEADSEFLTSSDIGTMASESKDDYYTKTAADTEFLSSNLGSENAGKFLAVDSTGSLEFTEGASSAQIAEAVEDYLDEHPISLDGYVETDQGVANKGNVMMVGADGNLSPVDYITKDHVMQSAVSTEHHYDSSDDFFVLGKYWLTNGSSGITDPMPSSMQTGASFFCYGPIELLPGDTIELKIVGGSGARAWAIYDGETKAAMTQATSSVNYLTDAWTYTATQHVYVLGTGQRGTDDANLNRSSITYTQSVSQIPTINGVKVEGDKTPQDFGFVSQIERVNYTALSSTEYASHYHADCYIDVINKQVGDVYATAKYVSLTGFFSYDKFMLKKGDKITVRSMGAYGGRAWVIVDAATREIIEIADQYETSINNPHIYIADRAVEFFGTCQQGCSASFEIEIERDYGNLNDTVAEISAEVTELKSTISSDVLMYNPKINFDKEEFRVLHLGSSLGEDSTHYLSGLVTDLGVDQSKVSMCRGYRGGGGFKAWWDTYHDLDSTHSYTIVQLFGGLTETFTGTAAINNGEKFRHALDLSEHVWDVIVIQPSEDQCADWQTWENSYLREYVTMLRTCQPQATIAVMMMHSAFGRNPDTSIRWRLIVDGCSYLQKQYGIDMIIPVGTCVENLRASEINTSAHGFTRDGTHLADGLGDYTANLAYYEALWAPRFKKSMITNTYYPVSETPAEGYETDCVDVTAANSEYAKKAAILALTNPNNITNPDNKVIP